MDAQLSISKMFRALSVHNLILTLKYGALLLSFLGILGIFALSIYRLTFHPLAKYSGPWWAKVTSLPGAFFVAKGQLHLKTQKAHQRWGPVVRLGPNKLAFNSATALHGIYHSKEVQKSKGYLTMAPSPGVYNVFSAVDKSVHRHKRKVISQGLSDQSLRAFEPMALKEVDIFVEKLLKTTADQVWSAPIDMTQCCKYIGYNIMGLFGFGQSFNLQEKTDNHFLMDAVLATSKKAAVHIHYPALAKLQLEKLLARKTMEMRDKYLKLMAYLVKSRLEAGKNAHNDLFSFLIDAKDPETGEGFTKSELWTESRFLLIAGADATSTALSSFFFYLSAYPDCYNRLVDEIRTTFTSASDIRSGPKMSSCHYFRACIDEAMRMTPPITGTLWREVCAGGIVLDNEYIPAGCDVGVSLYAVHHNEAIYPEPWVFKPERWLPGEASSPEALKQARHAFNPFSIGSRACAARNMAYMELTDTLASTVWHLDFRRAEGALGGIGGGVAGAKNGRHREGEFQLEEYLTSHHEGPYLQFRRRKDVAAL